ncbi:MAG: NAD(P)/FAD-dependent oxidoreductase, partial [Burkholderiales bacterium]
MKAHARVVVIGGGVVGASVLYHLAKMGWSDVALLERRDLTAGSTWHAAGGFHAINSDPNVSRLQSYTIRLYREIQELSGQDVGLHMTGGISLAGTMDRLEWLKAEWAKHRIMGLSSELVTPEEIKKLCPIVDVKGVVGGLYDPNEGHVDTYGVTHAYVKAARLKGAEVCTQTRVVELNRRNDGHWDVVTDQGKVVAEHVVNAAGLWASRVGRMVGISLPVVPMEHTYIVSDVVPEIEALKKELPLMVDLEGFTYLRQERNMALLGIYERNPKHWSVDGVDWDFGTDLLPPDLERISDELMLGFQR